MQSTHSATRTRDHDEIRKWVEDRGGFPATVKSTARKKEKAGLLRIDFPDYMGGETLQRIDWDAFFKKFDEEDIDFLHQDETSNGSISRFCKFVSSDGEYEE